jgi:hypothetical protein
LVSQIAVDFYRQLIRVLHGFPVEGDAELQQVVPLAARKWQQEVEVAAAALERCLDAVQQVDANANIATLVEAWIDDLAQLRLTA